MKTNNKPTALERLELRRSKYQCEADECISSLDNNFDYLQENMASLLLRFSAKAIQSALPPFVQSLFSTTDNGRQNYGDGNIIIEDNDSDNGFFNKIKKQAIVILPIIIEEVKPILISMLMSKAKGMFSKRK